MGYFKYLEALFILFGEKIENDKGKTVDEDEKVVSRKPVAKEFKKEENNL